jgi:RHS repeat-associated protein
LTQPENQLCDTDVNGLVRQYQFDAEGKIGQIQAINTSTPFETYIYDANGDRTRKTDGGGTFTEYVRFNGQTLAEKNTDGTWSDYIFAKDQRIARADNYDVRIHMSGTNCSGCSNPNMFAGTTALTNANTYTVRQGDVLSWRQFQDGSALGGIIVTFLNNGVNSDAIGTLDSDGQPINADTTMNTWHLRSVDLSAFTGKTINGVDLFDWQTAPAGNWDIYYGDITLTSTDGTVIPLYNRAMLGTLSGGAQPSVTNFSVITEKFLNTPDASASTTYYSGDQIGSTRILTDGAGWPVSSSIYYPFGQEASTFTDNSPNHYKFTGKERDAESGLDYFGARYYASSMGRFMSPDWAAKVAPVPYAKLDDPQSLNLYSYVRNNPLSRADADGHCDAPSNLKGGQVGICVASYISAKTFDVIGVGDNRGTNGNGGTSRIQTTFTLDLATGQTNKPGDGDKVAQSTVLGMQNGLQGTGSSQVSPGASIDTNGNMHISVDQSAHSAYDVNGALGDISNHVNLQVTPDGKVGVDAGSTARQFPALEIYRYTTDGSTVSSTLIRNYPETNPSALRQPEQPLAPQAPQ